MTLPAPYYCHGGVTIYHGNCLEILPELEAGSVGVLVTDPPYGMDYRSGFGGRHGLCRITGDATVAMRDAALTFWGDRPAVVFGTWKVARPPCVRALLTWDKGLHVGAGDLSIPWKPNTEEVYILGEGFNGHRGSSILRFDSPHSPGRGRVHPAEKPVELLLALIGKCPAGAILDPFLGSGTTCVAAKLLGRKSIGVEISEKYCEIAANRCEQEVFDFGAPP